MFLRKDTHVRVRLFKSISMHRERVYTRQSDRGKYFAHARIILVHCLRKTMQFIVIARDVTVWWDVHTYVNE